MLKMKDFFFLFPVFALYKSPKQHPKEENNNFILAGHLATQAKTGSKLNINTHFPKRTIPERGGCRMSFTTGSGHPQWPDYGLSCSLRLQRPSRRQQPAGRWPGPASQQGCPPASAPPAAAAPWSGWVACQRCPCNEHMHQEFRIGFSPKGKAALIGFDDVNSEGKTMGIAQKRGRSQTCSVSHWPH